MSFQGLALYALLQQQPDDHDGQHVFVNELPMEPVAYGVVALCILMSLLLITFAFRNIGQRH